MLYNTLLHASDSVHAQKYNLGGGRHPPQPSLSPSHTLRKAGALKGSRRPETVYGDLICELVWVTAIVLVTQVYGDLVRVFRAHPGLWQAYVGGATGGPTELLLELPARPSYQQIEDKLRAMPDASINKSIMERMDREFKFNKDSLNRK
eukprot:584192-Pelagomonas_calceolata.AAC.1